MIPRTFITLAAAGLMSLACGFGTHPDEGGRYTPQFPQTPLSNQICEEDRECTVTSHIDGNCCGDACGASQPFNLSYFDTLTKHQRDICSDATFTCPDVTCPEKTTKTVARCVNKRCAAVEEPVVSAPE